MSENSNEKNLSESSRREHIISGTFDRITLAKAFKQKHFQVGDVLISRKHERFTVTKIYDVKRHMAGKAWDDGIAFEIVGSKKGRVFTIYVR